MSDFWYQISCNIDKAMHEDLESAFESLEAVAITFCDAGDQPLLEPKPGEMPLWQALCVYALFESDCEIDIILTTLFAQYPSIEFKLEKIENQSWEHTWKQDFKTVCIADKLWIVPSWETAPLDNKPIVHLDPGLAFGTGKHPTTNLCLEWLANHVTANDVVIDYGCGSGILAIAAVKLGCQQVYAVDYDEQALLSTKENAKRNKISNEKLHILSPNEVSNINSNIVIANIVAGPLLELAEKFADLVSSGGYIVLSGILTTQVDNIIDKYRHWFKLCPPVNFQDWVRLEGIRI